MRSKHVVHVVMACTSYEGSSPVRAFADAAAASAFKDSLDAWDRKRPQAPCETVDTPENDAEHAAWWRRLERWRKRHPAGEELAFHDRFEVIELPFMP